MEAKLYHPPEAVIKVAHSFVEGKGTSEQAVAATGVIFLTDTLTNRPKYSPYFERLGRFVPIQQELRSQIDHDRQAAESPNTPPEIAEAAKYRVGVGMSLISRVFRLNQGENAPFAALMQELTSAGYSETAPLSSDQLSQAIEAERQQELANLIEGWNSYHSTPLKNRDWQARAELCQRTAYLLWGPGINPEERGKLAAVVGEAQSGVRLFAIISGLDQRTKLPDQSKLMEEKQKYEQEEAKQQAAIEEAKKQVAQPAAPTTPAEQLPPDQPSATGNVIPPTIASETEAPLTDDGIIGKVSPQGKQLLQQIAEIDTREGLGNPLSKPLIAQLAQSHYHLRAEEITDAIVEAKRRYRLAQAAQSPSSSNEGDTPKVKTPAELIIGAELELREANRDRQYEKQHLGAITESTRQRLQAISERMATILIDIGNPVIAARLLNAQSSYVLPYVYDALARLDENIFKQIKGIVKARSSAAVEFTEGTSGQRPHPLTAEETASLAQAAAAEVAKKGEIPTDSARQAKEAATMAALEQLAKQKGITIQELLEQLRQKEGG